ncbi:MAG: hypothetical protein JSR21_17315 [Proteobacteria bacterium]|nr:hypothetical protein [Pseudomonadota bacterium]
MTPRRAGIARSLLLAGLVAASPLAGRGAAAQQLDLSQGGPVTVTARDGIDWNQNTKQVIAHGQARAVRGAVTVDADRLIAYYRKKADAAGGEAAKPPAKPPAAASAQPGGGAADADTGGTEIYRLEAVGNVRVYTPTDQAQGDRAIYDMDQAVLVMTGNDLKLTTPNEVLTARDALEYWPQKHMAVARGNAVVVTKDARRMAADTLVAYTSDQDNKQAQPGPQGGTTQVAAKTPQGGAPDDPLAASGKLQKVEAFGHVSVRTPTDTVTGDRAVYVPDTGIARILGNVRITRGENQLNGSEAEVNQKTGIARLIAGHDERVQGLVVPNDSSNPAATPAAPGAKPPAKAATP